MKVIYFSSSVLLRLSAKKSQKKAKTTDSNAFLMFSKKRRMDVPDCG